MGLFNKWKKDKSEITIDQLINEPFKQQYMEECKFIWKNYVPKNGQAHVLQGELLRQIEKLRCEAQDNGNINWDDDYEFFCDFLRDTLSKQTFLSHSDKSRVVLAIDYLKTCGNYARDYREGKICDEKLNVDKLAYIGDNLYDIVADTIGLLQNKYDKPIPYSYNNLSR